MHVRDVPSDLRSILHSNLAFAYIKLKNWLGAEEDCSAALALNERNAKAVYRRGVARFELGKLEAALQDVEQVLKEMPDPRNNAEAVELKQKIVDRLKSGTSMASDPAVAKPAVEASAGKSIGTPQAAEPPKSADGFRRMQIVEASDSESESGDKEPTQAVQGSVKSAAPSQPSVQTVAATANVDSQADMFPDISIECSRQGVEKGKDQGNALFAKGSTEESVRWFSKCIWLMDSKRVPDVPSDLRSILHSNRAFAYIKLKNWLGAEEDSSASLALNARNTKAMYRRAIARFELGKDQDALQDVEQVLKEMPDSFNNAEAVELKRQIVDRLKSGTSVASDPAVAKPASRPRLANQSERHRLQSPQSPPMAS